MTNKLKKTLGFGCMRLPEQNGKVDIVEFTKMVDEYLLSNFNYFDTAFGYHSGESETALYQALVKRYKREDFRLADKLTIHFVHKKEDVTELFNTQLKKCGVEYFDNYLFHAMCDEYHKNFLKLDAYEQIFKQKQDGKIKKLGMSFHDRAFVLEKLLKALPEIDFVQIQFNYWDFLDVAVESKKCYDICVKYNKPVYIMEPIKGGRLINLPQSVQSEFEKMFQGKSNAQMALNFVANFQNVDTILSGMSSLSQVKENLKTFDNLLKLSESEMDNLLKIGEMLRSLDTISCTACRYCLDVCNKKIPIPYIIAAFNKKKLGQLEAENDYVLATKDTLKAIDCVKCGACEKVCPQHIDIREHLKKSARVFDKTPDNVGF